MNTYTVMLVYPDSDHPYIDTFLQTVQAHTPEEAANVARDACTIANEWEEGACNDYQCVLVIAGKHDDLNPR